MQSCRPPWSPLEAVAVALLVLVVPSGCGPTAERAEPSASEVERAEPSASEVERDAPTPARESVVSLSPVASRFVLALGARHLLLGVDPASARIPGLEDLPALDLAGAGEMAPDLVLLPDPPAPDDPVAQALVADGVDLVPFAPHDLEEVFALVRDVGTRLAGAARAQAFESRLARPLAAIGGASLRRPRPRVLAVVGIDPLVIAGGHSFETDLIEIAGGSSITHGGEEPRLELVRDAWGALAPDLVLVVGPDAPTEAERRAVLERLPDGAPVEFYSVDTQQFWLEDAAEPARRLRALIERVSRDLEPPIGLAEVP